MYKKFLSLLLALAMGLSIVSFSAIAEETVSFTDSIGREVQIPATIERLAPSGPLAQIMLFALVPERFVGISTEWSPEAEEFLGDYFNLPVLGQLYGSGDLNLEQLAAMDPQIVIDVGEAKGPIVEDMNALQTQLGIPVIHVDAKTATFADAYRILGKVLDCEERGEALAAYCEKVYARAESIMETVGEANKVNLLYLLGEDGLNVIAKGSYHAEIIDLVGNNLAVVDNPSGKGTGNPVDMEQLLIWNPDTIIFAPGSVFGAVKEDPTWQELTAIQEGNYVEVPFGPYNWMGFPPSVQRYLGILWLAKLLYSEAANYDLFQEVAEYYSLFYHCELTQEQYDRLMANASFQQPN